MRTVLPAWALAGAVTSPVRAVPSGAVHRASTSDPVTPPYPMSTIGRGLASTTALTSCQEDRWRCCTRSAAESAQCQANTASNGAPARNRISAAATMAASTRSEVRRSGLRSGHRACSHSARGSRGAAVRLSLMVTPPTTYQCARSGKPGSADHRPDRAGLSSCVFALRLRGADPPPSLVARVARSSLPSPSLSSSAARPLRRGQPLTAPVKPPTRCRWAKMKQASAGSMDSAVKARMLAVSWANWVWKLATASGSV